MTHDELTAAVEAAGRALLEEWRAALPDGAEFLFATVAVGKISDLTAHYKVPNARGGWVALNLDSGEVTHSRPPIAVNDTVTLRPATVRA